MLQFIYTSLMRCALLHPPSLSRWTFPVRLCHLFEHTGLHRAAAHPVIGSCWWDFNPAQKSVARGNRGAPRFPTRSCHGNREFRISTCRWQPRTPSHKGRNEVKRGVSGWAECNAEGLGWNLSPLCCSSLQVEILCLSVSLCAVEHRFQLCNAHSSTLFNGD